MYTLTNYVIFKTRAAVFYRNLKHETISQDLDPIKHVLRILWTASKTTHFISSMAKFFVNQRCLKLSPARLFYCLKWIVFYFIQILELAHFTSSGNPAQAVKISEKLWSKFYQHIKSPTWYWLPLHVFSSWIINDFLRIVDEFLKDYWWVFEGLLMSFWRTIDEVFTLYIVARFLLF